MTPSSPPGLGDDFDSPRRRPAVDGDYPKWFWALVIAGGLLAAVFPAFYLVLGRVQARPFEQRNARMCIVNLRNIWQDASIYALDHQTLPDAEKWTDELMPYVRKRPGGTAVLQCPSFAVPYGYAMQSVFGGRRPAEINLPARALVFYDSTTGRANATDDLDSFPVLQRHLGKGNAIFADGHTSALTRDESRAFIVQSMHGE